MVYWLVLLWVNPKDHRIEWGEQTEVYASITECERAKARLDVPAIMVRNEKGEQLLPSVTCVSAKK